MTDLAALRTQIAVFAGHQPSISPHHQQRDQLFDLLDAGTFDAVHMVGESTRTLVGDTAALEKLAFAVAAGATQEPTAFVCAAGDHPDCTLFCGSREREVFVLRSSVLSADQMLSAWQETSTANE